MMYITVQLHERTPNYIYVDENNIVHLLLPAIGGTTVATDNTCRTAIECKNFFGAGQDGQSAQAALNHYRRQLTEDIALCESLGLIVEADEKRQRLKQVNAYLQLLRRIPRPAFDGAYSRLPQALVEILSAPGTNTASILLDPREHDNITRAFHYICRFNRRGPEAQRFSKVLKRRLHDARYFSRTDPATIIKNRLGAYIDNIVVNSADSQDKLSIEALLSEIARLVKEYYGCDDKNNPVLKFKEDHLARPHMNLYQWVESYSAENFKVEDLIDSIFNYCNVSAREKMEDLAAETPFVALADMPAFNQEHPEADRFSIYLQILFAEINFYCQRQQISQADFGQKLEALFGPDGNEAMANELIDIIKRCFIEPISLEEQVMHYINRHHQYFECRREICEDDMQSIKKRFFIDARTIKDSPHFDEFILFDPSGSGPAVVHQGRISVHFLDYCESAGAGHEWRDMVESAVLDSFRQAKEHGFAQDRTQILPGTNDIHVHVSLPQEEDLAQCPFINMMILKKGAEFWFECMSHEDWIMLAHHRYFESKNGEPGIQAHLIEALHQRYPKEEAEAAEKRLYAKIEEAKNLKEAVLFRLDNLPIDNFNSLSGMVSWRRYFGQLKHQLMSLRPDSPIVHKLKAIEQRYQRDLELITAYEEAQDATILLNAITHQLSQTDSQSTWALFKEWFDYIDQYVNEDKKKELLYRLIQITQAQLKDNKTFNQQLASQLIKTKHFNILMQLAQESHLEIPQSLDLTLAAINSGDIEAINSLVTRRQLNFRAKEASSGFNLLHLAIRIRKPDFLRKFIALMPQDLASLALEQATIPRLNPLEYALSLEPVAWDMVSYLLRLYPKVDYDYQALFDKALRDNVHDIIMLIIDKGYPLPQAINWRDGKILENIYILLGIDYVIKTIDKYPVSPMLSFEHQARQIPFIDYLAKQRQWHDVAKLTQQHYDLRDSAIVYYMAQDDYWALMDWALAQGASVSWHGPESRRTVFHMLAASTSLTVERETQLLRQILQSLSAKDGNATSWNKDGNGNTMVDLCLRHQPVKAHLLKTLLDFDFSIENANLDIIKVLAFAYDNNLEWLWPMFNKYINSIAQSCCATEINAITHATFIQHMREPEHVLSFISSLPLNLVQYNQQRLGLISIENPEHGPIYVIDEDNLHWPAVALIIDNITYEADDNRLYRLFKRAIEDKQYEIISKLLERFGQTICAQCNQYNDTPLQTALIQQDKDLFQCLYQGFKPYMTLSLADSGDAFILKSPFTADNALGLQGSQVAFSTYADMLLADIDINSSLSGLTTYYCRINAEESVDRIEALFRTHPLVSLSLCLVTMPLTQLAESNHDAIEYINKYEIDINQRVNNKTILEYILENPQLEQTHLNDILPFLLAQGLDINQTIVHGQLQGTVAYYLLHKGYIDLLRQNLGDISAETDKLVYALVTSEALDERRKCDMVELLSQSKLSLRGTTDRTSPLNILIARGELSVFLKILDLDKDYPISQKSEADFYTPLACAYYFMNKNNDTSMAKYAIALINSGELKAEDEGIYDWFQFFVREGVDTYRQSIIQIITLLKGQGLKVLLEKENVWLDIFYQQDKTLYRRCLSQLKNLQDIQFAMSNPPQIDITNADGRVLHQFNIQHDYDILVNDIGLEKLNMTPMFFRHLFNEILIHDDIDSMTWLIKTYPAMFAEYNNAHANLLKAAYRVNAVRCFAELIHTLKQPLGPEAETQMSVYYNGRWTAVAFNHFNPDQQSFTCTHTYTTSRRSRGEELQYDDNCDCGDYSDDSYGGWSHCTGHWRPVTRDIETKHNVEITIAIESNQHRHDMVFVLTPHQLSPASTNIQYLMASMPQHWRYISSLIQHPLTAKESLLSHQDIARCLKHAIRRQAWDIFNHLLKAYPFTITDANLEDESNPLIDFPHQDHPQPFVMMLGRLKSDLDISLTVEEPNQYQLQLSYPQGDLRQIVSYDISLAILHDLVQTLIVENILHVDMANPAHIAAVVALFADTYEQGLDSLYRLIADHFADIIYQHWCDAKEGLDGIDLNYIVRLLSDKKPHPLINTLLQQSMRAPHPRLCLAIIESGHLESMTVDSEHIVVELVKHKLCRENSEIARSILHNMRQPSDYRLAFLQPMLLAMLAQADVFNEIDLLDLFREHQRRAQVLKSVQFSQALINFFQAQATTSTEFLFRLLDMGLRATHHEHRQWLLQCYLANRDVARFQSLLKSLYGAKTIIEIGTEFAEVRDKDGKFFPGRVVAIKHLAKDRQALTIQFYTSERRIKLYKEKYNETFTWPDDALNGKLKKPEKAAEVNFIIETLCSSLLPYQEYLVMLQHFLPIIKSDGKKILTSIMTHEQCTLAEKGELIHVLTAAEAIPQMLSRLACSSLDIQALPANFTIRSVSGLIQLKANLFRLLFSKESHFHLLLQATRVEKGRTIEKLDLLIYILKVFFDQAQPLEAQDMARYEQVIRLYQTIYTPYVDNYYVVRRAILEETRQICRYRQDYGIEVYKLDESLHANALRILGPILKPKGFKYNRMRFWDTPFQIKALDLLKDLNKSKSAPFQTMQSLLSRWFEKLAQRKILTDVKKLPNFTRAINYMLAVQSPFLTMENIEPQRQEQLELEVEHRRRIMG